MDAKDTGRSPNVVRDVVLPKSADPAEPLVVKIGYCLQARWPIKPERLVNGGVPLSNIIESATVASHSIVGFRIKSATCAIPDSHVKVIDIPDQPKALADATARIRVRCKVPGNGARREYSITVATADDQIEKKTIPVAVVAVSPIRAKPSAVLITEDAHSDTHRNDDVLNVAEISLTGTVGDVGIVGVTVDSKDFAVERVLSQGNNAMSADLGKVLVSVLNRQKEKRQSFCVNVMYRIAGSGLEGAQTIPVLIDPRKRDAAGSQRETRKEKFDSAVDVLGGGFMDRGNSSPNRGGSWHNLRFSDFDFRHARSGRSATGQLRYPA